MTQHRNLTAGAAKTPRSMPRWVSTTGEQDPWSEVPDATIGARRSTELRTPTKHAQNHVCCLCGEPIPVKPQNPADALSMDHVPPKQFYPKEIRDRQDLNLWSVPTHKRCNEAYRGDEEYFYVYAYPLVGDANRQMWQVIHRDLARRARKPQIAAMARRLRRDFKTVTDGGVHLPPGIAAYDLDAYRVQRVVLKIAQGLFYRDYGRHLALQDCKEIRLCQAPSDVPELYQLSCQGAEGKAALLEVFSYWCFEFENLLLFSMLFWESFMFCSAFENPCPPSVASGETPPQSEKARPTIGAKA